MSPVDLAGCSALGGSLLTSAAQVADLALAVQSGRRALDVRGACAAAVAVTQAEGEDLERAAGALCDLGAALQAYTTGMAEVAASERELREAARRAGCDLVEGRIEARRSGIDVRVLRLLEDRNARLARQARSHRDALARASARATGILRSVTLAARARSDPGAG